MATNAKPRCQDANSNSKFERIRKSAKRFLKFQSFKLVHKHNNKHKSMSMRKIKRLKHSEQRCLQHRNGNRTMMMIISCCWLCSCSCSCWRLHPVMMAVRITTHEVQLHVFQVRREVDRFVVAAFWAFGFARAKQCRVKRNLRIHSLGRTAIAKTQ